MSEEVFGYTIRYVDIDHIIDPDNHNKLISATIKLADTFADAYERIIECFGIEELEEDLKTYVSFIEECGLRELVAEHLAPVYTYYYMIIKDVLSATASSLGKLFSACPDVPEESKMRLREARSILDGYPLLERMDIVDPKHHNDLLRALSLLAELVEQAYYWVSEQRILGPLKTYVWNVWDNVVYWRYAFTEYFKIYERGFCWWIVGFEDWRDFDYNEPVLRVEVLSVEYVKITIAEVDAVFRSALYYGDQLLSSDIRRDVGKSWIVEVP
ncbi:MAG: hypothetical protein QXE85_00005 [Nitrososphaerota archaeon]